MLSLDEVYMEKLKALYNAEEQTVAALPKMARAASSPALQDALQNHLEETRAQIGRLDRVFEMLGASGGGGQCAGMKGLLEEGEEILSDQEQGAVLDAALIAAAQSVEHYEIAAYGTAQTWARLLGQSEVADLVEETLEEETKADEKLAEIAETLVNPEAGGVAPADDTEPVQTQRRKGAVRARAR